MSADRTWKASLGTQVPEAWGRGIDIFETQIELRKKGKIEEKLFAETRLRRGPYGQRYDNGQRHDGEKTQALAFPSKDITKGPSTMWDAPGMQRIKIPFGRLTADQLDVLADVAEEYSDRILHVTTRQDFQLHFVHIEDTPDLQRRLAASGITTREACGNTVRNVTACPYAGVCNEERFDVTPYAKALTFFLLGHDDTQDFGRKFKVAFSGCKENACGLTNFHDLGATARTREVDGVVKRGFELVVGGGLGAVPQAALVFDEFLPEEELLPIAQAMSRVFSRLGRAPESRAGSVQVRRQEAGHRGDQASRARRARQAPPRSAMDGVPGRSRTPPTRSPSARRARCRRSCRRASSAGARPTSSRSARPGTSWRSSRSPSAT